MSHREIREALAEFGQWRLERRAKIEEHLATCPDCREWLATYELLAGELARTAESEHPTAQELAEWAADDEEPPAAATAHLVACATCRGDLEAVEAALRVSRSERQAAADLGQPRERRRSAAAVWALAASLAFAGLAVSILLMRQGGEVYAIAGGALTGEEVIKAPSISASQVEIQGGSKIVFEASDLVSLGEGFVVAAGATFEAGTTGRANGENESNNREY